MEFRCNLFTDLENERLITQARQYADENMQLPPAEIIANNLLFQTIYLPAVLERFVDEMRDVKRVIEEQNDLIDHLIASQMQGESLDV